MILPPDVRAECIDAIRKAHIARSAIQYIQNQHPSWLFRPWSADSGQIKSLESNHKIRILIPGNGFGKTTVMGMDADMLMQRDDPFKPDVMPRHDPTAIWFCQKYQQFEVMRQMLETKIWTGGWRWNGRDKYYHWPNGSRLFVLSSDSDWTAAQGIEIDAVYFDEHPDKKFWNEMMFRRRGERKARFMVSATMTQGMTWFVKQVIQPWEAFNKKLGRTNAKALTIQDHPDTFLWNIGGIADNPAMTQEDIDHYDSIETSSEKEREVRVHGGYADFSGSPVFNIDHLKKMELEATEGESGMMVFLPDQNPELREKVEMNNIEMAYPHRFGGVMDRSFVEWRAGLEMMNGRITIWEPPVADETYVAGGDFAAGLIGMDYDCLTIGRKSSEGRVVQVAEATGHWGDVFFAETIYLLCLWYNEAFLCGERQFGLPCLRRLHDEMGYSYQYYAKSESNRARRRSDLLGHHRSAGDTIIPNLRLAIRQDDVRIRSRPAIEQLKHYQFQPKRTTQTMEDVDSSFDLKTGGPLGENDDHVMSIAYMWHAAREVVHFPKPKPKYRKGTFGDVFSLDKLLEDHHTADDPYAIN